MDNLTEAELEEGQALYVEVVRRGHEGPAMDRWHLWCFREVPALISELREAQKRIVELEAENDKLSVELQRWQGMVIAQGNEITHIVDLRGI